MVHENTGRVGKKRGGQDKKAVAARRRGRKKLKKLRARRAKRDRAANQKTGGGQGSVRQISLSKLRANQWGGEFNPDISAAERKTLKRSVEEVGIQTPLIGWKRRGEKLIMIVAGGTRLSIAQELELKTVPVIVKTFESEIAAKLFAVRDNLCRRHLTAGQKAQLALTYQKLLRVGQGYRTDLTPGPSSDVTKVDSRREAAKVVGISEGSMSKMKKVIDSHDDMLIEKVRNGETSISAAARTVDARSERPKPVQRETVGAKNRIYAAIVGGNPELMANVASLYIEPEIVVADVTYGAGAFWTDVDRSAFSLLQSDIDPVDENVKKADCRDLPYADRTADVVVIDLVYDGDPLTALTKLGRKAVKAGKKHGSTVALHTDALTEAIRVTKLGGLIMVKIGDDTESGKYYHIEIKAVAEELGLVAEDLFVLVRNTRPPVHRRYQKRARRNCSFMWVFRRAN